MIANIGANVLPEERGSLNDMLRPGITIKECKLGPVDYSVERPFATDNERSRNQKQKRVNAFRKVEHLLGIHDSTKSNGDILKSNVIVHPFGVQQMQNDMMDNRTVYHPSELSMVEWHCTRENYRTGCASYQGVLKQGSFVIENSATYSTGSICKFVNK